MKRIRATSGRIHREESRGNEIIRLKKGAGEVMVVKLDTVIPEEKCGICVAYWHTTKVDCTINAAKENLAYEPPQQLQNILLMLKKNCSPSINF